MVRAQAERWYDLLSPAQARLVALGADQVQVTSTLPGDRRPATERLTLTWSDRGELTVAAAEGTPLWALESAVVTTGPAGTVLSAASEVQAKSWLALAAEAVAAVRASGVADDGWTGRLVLEAPVSADDFALLTGSTADTSSAVTSCRTGTPRIVLSPKLSEFSDDVRFATLTHEAVHAATDSACQHGLSWAVEGLAESVAAHADPATAAANRRLVVDYLATHPVPSALPEHPSTPTDYALAQVAADELRRRLGAAAPAYFARATRAALSDTEIAQATTWYRQALRSLGG